MKHALKNPAAFVALTLCLVGTPVVLGHNDALYDSRGILSEFGGFRQPARRGQHHFAEFAVLQGSDGTLRVTAIDVLEEEEPDTFAQYWFGGGNQIPVAYSVWYRHTHGWGLVLHDLSYDTEYGTLGINGEFGFDRADVVTAFAATTPNSPPHYFVDLPQRGFNRSKVVRWRLHPIGLAVDLAYVHLVVGWIVSLVSIRTWPTWVRAKIINRAGCPHCGYSRDGLVADTCPECGERFED